MKLNVTRATTKTLQTAKNHPDPGSRKQNKRRHITLSRDWKHWGIRRRALPWEACPCLQPSPWLPQLIPARRSSSALHQQTLTPIHHKNGTNNILHIMAFTITSSSITHSTMPEETIVAMQRAPERIHAHQWIRNACARIATLEIRGVRFRRRFQCVVKREGAHQAWLTARF